MANALAINKGLYKFSGFDNASQTRTSWRYGGVSIQYNVQKELSGLQGSHGSKYLAPFQPCYGLRKSMIVRASKNDSDAPQSGPKESAKQSRKSVREMAGGFLNKKTGYFWLVGPILLSTMVVVPPALLSPLALFEKSYWLGLGAIFALDLLFVLSADAFFVLTDKVGHHQNVAGGPPPWIGPWEYTGYPKGLPYLWESLSYAGVGMGVFALILSIIVGKLPVGIAVICPYLALVFIQVAYERLLGNDRLPTYPLVPILYTMYRFRQLARGMELVSAFAGGIILAGAIRMILSLWTLYLAIHLAQLPWLYSTWNANRAT